ncbi:MAG TPA: class I tRNA ligase family protein [Candidatus Woesebacteria bacterium]|nr:class I tRNA ligase family protein [Candidatus Woesebacteria bacterium]
MKKFFITTPIYYINAEPSIGSACSTIAADIIARLHRQEGEEVFFLTGTDEHGEKIAEAALKVGLPPIEFCNRIAPKYEEAWKLLNISYNFFIRTTDPRHKKVVGEVMQKIYDAGDIYKDKYLYIMIEGASANAQRVVVNGAGAANNKTKLEITYTIIN